MVMQCVIRNGRIETVALRVGETNAVAMPLDSGYIANLEWFKTAEPLSFAGDHYIMYGLPRVVGSTDLEPINTFRGVTVFVEAVTDHERPEVIYLPTRPGCEFQPYMRLGSK